MRQNGMPADALQLVFQTTVIPKLLYASSSWWGFTTAQVKDRIEALIRRATKFGYYSSGKPDALSIHTMADMRLLTAITTQPNHCLKPLMPPERVTNYNLRPRGHNFILPKKDNRNFVNRILYQVI